jgi:nucleotide-binding universal stress UspA family protein
MNLLTLRERIARSCRLDAAPARIHEVARVLRSHRHVLLALDRTDDVDTVLPAIAAGVDGTPLDLDVLVVLPAWSACTLEMRRKEHLQRLSEETTSPTLRVSGDVRLGEPVQTVLETASRRDADLIAMTVHRVGVLDRLLDHSILEEVLRRSPVPVVAVPNLAGLSV